MKIAIVHDYLKEYGGAEKVVEALLEIWPKTPVFTSVYLPKYAGPHRQKISKWDIRTTFLQSIPLKGKLLSPFRLIAPAVFSNLDLSSFDVVIVSAAGTYTGMNSVKVGPKTLLITYCHTPPRYLYGFPTAADWEGVWWRKVVLGSLGKVIMHFLRIIDFESAQKPKFFIANSEEVKARIWKFYKREATVINPPVDIPEQAGGDKKREYYLAGGRLARHKRQDLAIKACTELGLPLKVFGGTFSSYGQNQLKEFAGPTVEFLGEVTDNEKWDLYRGAKALIFPSEHEDFGIMPVEAMAAGTPVIALRSGGSKETILEGKTGLFFDKPEVQEVVKTIKKFEKLNLSSADCRKQASKFSKARFKKEIQDFVKLHSKSDQ